MMNKQEILKAIRVCAKKLGHSPSLRELRRLAGVNGSRFISTKGSFAPRNSFRRGSGKIAVLCFLDFDINGG